MSTRFFWPSQRWAMGRRLVGRNKFILISEGQSGLLALMVGDTLIATVQFGTLMALFYLLTRKLQLSKVLYWPRPTNIYFRVISTIFQPILFYFLKTSTSLLQSTTCSMVAASSLGNFVSLVGLTRKFLWLWHPCLASTWFWESSISGVASKPGISAFQSTTLWPQSTTSASWRRKSPSPSATPTWVPSTWTTDQAAASVHTAASLDSAKGFSDAFLMTS